MTQPSPSHPTTENQTALEPGAARSDDGQSARGERRKLDLPMGSIIVGSLAAITAAALGAQLGVAGTIIGAGVGSMISTVAAAIFNASWQSGRSGLRVAYDRTVQRRDGTIAGDADTSTDQPARDKTPRTTSRTWLRIPLARWRLLAMGTAATFLIAFVSITAYETITGQTLSGDRGTTISRLADGAGTSVPPTEPPAPAPQNTAPSPDSGDGDSASSPEAQSPPSSTDPPAAGTSTAPSDATPESAPSPPSSPEPEPSPSPSPSPSPEPTEPGEEAAPSDEGTDPAPDGGTDAPSDDAATAPPAS